MVRSLAQQAALPFMIGLLSLGSSFIIAPKLEMSKYSTKGLELCYDVPFVEDVNPINAWSYEPLPIIGDSYLGFKEALAFKESRGDYLIVNAFGYLGKYQFGKSTLALMGIHNSACFLENPILQERAFLRNTSRNKWILRRDIKRYSGKNIGGVHITESGILAAAHLAGAGSVKSFLRSDGVNQFSDGFGTSIKSYLEKFSGYDMSFVEAVKNPRLKGL